VFVDVVARRGRAVPAAVAFSYLAMEMRIPVPEAVLARTVDLADRAGLSRWSSVLQAKPRTDFGSLVWLSRGLAKQLRLKRKRGQLQQLAPAPAWRGKPVIGKAKAVPMPFVLSQTNPDTAGEMMLDLTVRIAVPPVRRRIEMEINAAGRHVARLRSVAISRAGGDRVLRFRGKVTPDGERQDLTLEAHPVNSANGTMKRPSPPMVRCPSSCSRQISRRPDDGVARAGGRAQPP
jgi:hypothetical protein